MKQLIFTTISILVFSFSAFAQAETCPKIEVVGGGVVRTDEPIYFTAKLNNVENNLFESRWKISAGIITKGQKTASITIDTTGLSDGTIITATVEINGLPQNCLNTASQTGAVYRFGDIFPLVDEFGKLPRNEVRARTDAFFVTLKNEPNAQGYVVNYGTDKEIAAREQLIRNHIAFRKYDANRVTFIKGSANPRGEKGVWTRFFAVPPGAEPPIP